MKREGITIKSQILKSTLIAGISIVASVHAASPEMSPVGVYYIPGSTGIIEQVQFNDVDNDGFPEILACDGEKLILYSADTDDILFESPLDPRHTHYKILFDDINRDLVPDILVGYYYGDGSLPPDTVCRLDFYDGASNFTLSESLFFEAETGAPDPVVSPSSFLTLHSFDLANDGFNQLLFSYDRYRVTAFGDSRILVTTGETSLYYSLGSQLGWNRPVLLKDARALEAPDGTPLIVGNRYDNLVFSPGDSRTNAWIEIMSTDGDSIQSIAEPVPSLCNGGSSATFSAVECLTVGDIHPVSPDPDILVRYYWRQICYQSDEVSFDSCGSSLRLYRVLAPDNVQLLWSDLSPPAESNLNWLPRFAGQFFAARDGVVYQLDGLNGELLACGEPMDVDTIIWCLRPEHSGGDFVTVKNQTIRVYRVDLSTDVTNPDDSHQLPNSFALHRSYPNPFNASCVIGYSLSHSAHTTITVHNVLGQKVATLVNRHKPTGYHTLTWHGVDDHGKPVASGIYLCRMVAKEFVDSKKLLLIK
ncbi:MAG: T9SS type A sorting domain-containing protein [Candidatus Zixiibacteriota bacterium]|nr:MAG: T9SS type A sorting domain-containing protein [candidate division Zixibacteria bacterium]